MPALCRAGPLQTPQRGTGSARRWLRDTQEHNRLLMARRTLAVWGWRVVSFYCPIWSTWGGLASRLRMTVVGTLRFIKPNETAHCSQRTDTGRRSNPRAAVTGPYRWRVLQKCSLWPYRPSVPLSLVVFIENRCVLFLLHSFMSLYITAEHEPVIEFQTFILLLGRHLSIANHFCTTDINVWLCTF